MRVLQVLLRQQLRPRLLEHMQLPKIKLLNNISLDNCEIAVAVFSIGIILTFVQKQIRNRFVKMYTPKNKLHRRCTTPI